jgi:hypothetical protein
VLFTRHQLDTKRLYVLMTSHLKAMFKRIPEGGNAASRNKDPLPTFSQWKELCSDNTRVTVRDMWGRVLCSIPRAHPLAQPFIVKQRSDSRDAPAAPIAARELRAACLFCDLPYELRLSPIVSCPLNAWSRFQQIDSRYMWCMHENRQ